MRTKTLILAAALAAASWAEAQTVWRCGNSYGQQPCAGGTPVAASDERTGAQAARGASVARDDWALADRLQKERLAQEKNAGKALVIGGPQSAAAPASAKKEAGRKKGAKPEEFTAVAPGAPKHKKKKAKD